MIAIFSQPLFAAFPKAWGDLLSEQVGKRQSQSLIIIFSTSPSICFSPSGKEDRWLMYMKETWEPI